MLAESIGSDVRMHPRGPLRGTVTLPGSKSITNRALFCAALADGPTRIRGASLSDDAHAMLAGLQALGIDARADDTAPELIVRGGGLRAAAADLNPGHAGTAVRFLTALCTLGYGRFRMDGSPRMRQRPIGVLVDALRRLGARIDYEQNEGFVPLQIEALGLRGGEVRFVETPSSQFVSAVLLAAPAAFNDVQIAIEGQVTSRPYLELTIAVMRAMGVDLLEQECRRFIVPGLQPYRGGVFDVEPDASAAAYFWSAAAVTGGRVRVAGLTRASRQGDARFVDVLAEMGCSVSEGTDYLEVAAPSTFLRGIDADLNALPDTAQTLAVVALFARGPTTIRNVANLRIKETDRLAALAAELTRCGARVEAGPDWIRIDPPERIAPATIETYEDHRMAMSFAVAGAAASDLLIREVGCVSKSFPGFFDVLNRLVECAATGEGAPPAT